MFIVKKHHLVIWIIILTLTAAGCSQSRLTDVQLSEQGNADVGDAVGDSSKSIAVTSPIPELQRDIVDFEQNPNIIEDNYRNYYEIFVYSFYDSDGDGIGDINGIREKLDYINDGDSTTTADMGFNGIWLMPIMPSTTYHKYDVIDYYDIDPEYGTLEDFKALVEACHGRDIRLIIDLVLNHTSTQHEWFQSASAYLASLEVDQEPNNEDNPYVGYYNFTKEYDGSDHYHRIGNSDWYYEGVFWGEMPDLNLDNPLVRKEIESIAEFWLGLGVDGFRLDAVKEFHTGDKSKNVEVLTWFNDYVTSLNEDVYVVGEAWASHGAIKEYYTSGVRSFFNFPYARFSGEITMTARQLGTSSAKKFGETMERFQKAYSGKNSTFIDAPFVSNHDTTRVSAQCVNNMDQMKMAAGLVMMSNGSPFVYYGEEIGMNSAGSKDENKRLPMYWSATDTNGTTVKPSNADEVDQIFDPVDVQLRDPLSLLNYYKKALILRNENPEIARGEIRFDAEISSKTVCVINKDYEDSQVTIIYNINKEGTVIDLTGTIYENLDVIGCLDVDGSGVVYEDGKLSLGKYTIAVLK